MKIWNALFYLQIKKVLNIFLPFKFDLITFSIKKASSKYSKYLLIVWWKILLFEKVLIVLEIFDGLTIEPILFATKASKLLSSIKFLTLYLFLISFK